MTWLDRVPLVPLLLVAVFMALAPFQPEPHLLEKLRMLRAGALQRPIDIFDLAWHAAPLVLLALKLGRWARTARAEQRNRSHAD
ncbi:MAG: RND transporter [Betaproteobacteria bacterium SG8_39]|nr:MAG: RND transporter [Betaproteobacteria bacterium SG8_39]